MNQPVSVGRIVHFTNVDGNIYPAIVVAVRESAVIDLTVFRPWRQSFDERVSQGAAGTPGTWHWPAIPMSVGESRP